jgi:hypothetical protein
MKNGIAKGSSTLRMNDRPRVRVPRNVQQPSPTGNRRERRAYAAQQKQQDKRP